MNYEQIKERATTTVNECYMKKYTEEEVVVLREHFKTLSGDALTEEISIILDSYITRFESHTSFNVLMREYKEEILKIQDKWLLEDEEVLKIQTAVEKQNQSRNKLL